MEMDLEHQTPYSLRVSLISPSGTESVLVEPRPPSEVCGLKRREVEKMEKLQGDEGVFRKSEGK